MNQKIIARRKYRNIYDGSVVEVVQFNSNLDTSAFIEYMDQDLLLKQENIIDFNKKFLLIGETAKEYSDIFFGAIEYTLQQKYPDYTISYSPNRSISIIDSYAFKLHYVEVISCVDTKKKEVFWNESNVSEAISLQETIAFSQKLLIEKTKNKFNFIGR